MCAEMGWQGLQPVAPGRILSVTSNKSEPALNQFSERYWSTHLQCLGWVSNVASAEAQVTSPGPIYPPPPCWLYFQSSRSNNPDRTCPPPSLPTQFNIQKPAERVTCGFPAISVLSGFSSGLKVLAGVTCPSLMFSLWSRRKLSLAQARCVACPRIPGMKAVLEQSPGPCMGEGPEGNRPAMEEGRMPSKHVAPQAQPKEEGVCVLWALTLETPALGKEKNTAALGRNRGA